MVKRPPRKRAGDTPDAPVPDDPPQHSADAPDPITVASHMVALNEIAFVTHVGEGLRAALAQTWPPDSNSREMVPTYRFINGDPPCIDSDYHEYPRNLLDGWLRVQAKGCGQDGGILKEWVISRVPS